MEYRPDVELSAPPLTCPAFSTTQLQASSLAKTSSSRRPDFLIWPSSSFGLIKNRGSDPLLPSSFVNSLRQEDSGSAYLFPASRSASTVEWSFAIKDSKLA